MKKKDEDENSDNVRNYFPAHCIMYKPFTKKHTECFCLSLTFVSRGRGHERQRPRRGRRVGPQRGGARGGGGGVVSRRRSPPLLAAALGAALDAAAATAVVVRGDHLQGGDGKILRERY